MSGIVTNLCRSQRTKLFYTEIHTNCFKDLAVEATDRQTELPLTISNLIQMNIS